MDAIDGIIQNFEDHDVDMENAEVTEMMLIACVQIPADDSTDERPHGRSHVVFWASELLPHRQLGLVETAAESIRMRD